MAIPSETGVTWTSSRNIQVYNGTQYEVQELRAVPTGSNSCLQIGNMMYKKSVSTVEVTQNALKTIAANVAGYIPKIGGDLGAEINVAQLIKDLCGVQTSGSINNV